MSYNYAVEHIGLFAIDIMEKVKEFYRRKLPHIIPPGNIFFITSRLAGSLPQTVIEELKQREERNTESLIHISDRKKRFEKYIEYQDDYFKIFDDALIKYSNGPYWLREDKIAEIIKEALLYRDKKVYDIFAFTIMSNHIHIIIRPYKDVSISPEEVLTQLPENQPAESINIPSVGQLGKLSTPGRNIPSPYILGDIMESLKRYTAAKCNKYLSRRGAFWQHENYDHMIRNYDELIDKIQYVLNNPVKAGLTDEYTNWKWNYFNPELL